MAANRTDTDWSHSNQHSSNGQELAASLDNVESNTPGSRHGIRSWADVDMHRLANSLAQGSGLAALEALNARMGAMMSARQPGVVNSHDHSLPAWTGAAPSTSETGVVTSSPTFETPAEHDTPTSGFEHFPAPNAEWSQSSLMPRQVSHTRANPAKVMETQSPPPNFFTTPNRGTPVVSAGAPLYQDTPTTNNRKRKADSDGIQLQIPAQSPVDQLATPTQRPPAAGIFGSQARSLRGGQQRCAQVDQSPVPPELIAQLHEIPQLLSGGMSDLTQMVTHLARKHKALEQRVLRLEHENRTLKGQQPLPPDPNTMEQNETMTTSEAMQAQQPASEYFYPEIGPQPRKKKRSRKAMPMPGGPYGGPLYTQPAKSPGMFSGMLTNNRQTVMPVQAPPPSVAARSPYRPLGPVSTAVPVQPPPSSQAMGSHEYPLLQETADEERDYYDFN